MKSAKDKAWDEMSRYVRIRDAVNGYCSCVTCGRAYPAGGQGCIQVGHYINRGYTALMFHPHNVHPQCYVCNCRRSGEPQLYRQWMIDRYGLEHVEYLESHMRIKTRSTTATWAEWKRRIMQAKEIAANGGDGDALLLEWWAEWLDGAKL